MRHAYVYVCVMARAMETGDTRAIRYMECHDTIHTHTPVDDTHVSYSLHTPHRAAAAGGSSLPSRLTTRPPSLLAQRDGTGRLSSTLPPPPVTHPPSPGHIRSVRSVRTQTDAHGQWRTPAGGLGGRHGTPPHGDCQCSADRRGPRTTGDQGPLGPGLRVGRRTTPGPASAQPRPPGSAVPTATGGVSCCPQRQMRRRQVTSHLQIQRTTNDRDHSVENSLLGLLTNHLFHPCRRHVIKHHQTLQLAPISIPSSAGDRYCDAPCDRSQTWRPLQRVATVAPPAAGGGRRH